MDRDLIDDLLDTLLGEWPADEMSGVREPCRLCEQAPVTDARITPDGPVHVYHTSPHVLPLAVESEHRGRLEIVRLAGWEVAQVMEHPCGTTHVSVLGAGRRAAADGTRDAWLQVCMDLWGYTEPAGWSAGVEALADRIEQRSIA